MIMSLVVYSFSEGNSIANGWCRLSYIVNYALYVSVYFCVVFFYTVYGPPIYFQEIRQESMQINKDSTGVRNLVITKILY